jgi:transcriptional regulator with XRE-family HTH domain
MDAQKTVGDRLDTAMRTAGYRSQKDLERTSGVPQATISRILKNVGRLGPETETIRKLARACGVPFEWLNEGGVGEMPVPVRPLSIREIEWLALLDDLGTDDVEEFMTMIRQRQSRNRRLLAELCKKHDAKQ